MSGFRRGLIANAAPKWRNFALDGGSIPMLGDDASVIATGDWEMYLEFELLSADKAASVFIAGYNDDGVPVVSFALYPPSQTTYSFNMYVPTSSITAVSQSPTSWWGGTGSNFVLVGRTAIPPVGKHTVRAVLRGDNLTFEIDNHIRVMTVTRSASGYSKYTTYAPTINGHIYRLYFKDLTNNRMLLDVPRSYLTK
jgi:hypothetical protein